MGAGIGAVPGTGTGDTTDEPAGGIGVLKPLAPADGGGRTVACAAAGPGWSAPAASFFVPRLLAASVATREGRRLAAS